MSNCSLLTLVLSYCVVPIINEYAEIFLPRKKQQSLYGTAIQVVLLTHIYETYAQVEKQIRPLLGFGSN